MPTTWVLRNRKATLQSYKIHPGGLIYQPPHVTMIRWLKDATKAKVIKCEGRPPVIFDCEGNLWPIRFFENEKRAFRSCYIGHIIGMKSGYLWIGVGS